jgi:hypothetical protein
MLLIIANKPLPSSWMQSSAAVVELWKESQLMYESWNLRSHEREEVFENASESSIVAEEEESPVLLLDLVEVALSLMKEVTSLGKQVAHYNRTFQNRE